MSLNIYKKIEERLRRYGVKRGAKLLIALSGGLDSMALAHLLFDLKKNWNFTLFAAHLDHGLRAMEEGKKDWFLIQKECHNIFEHLFYHSIPQGKLQETAKSQNISIEALARTQRYDFLFRCLEESKSDFLVLAHHQDDQEETMIMRFFQGAGPQGLKGIPGKRGAVIRPLLDCQKFELEAYLKDQSIGFSFDKSNNDESFLRNNLRLNLIPEIRKIFPGMSRSLTRLHDYMDELAGYIQKEASGVFSWSEAWQGWIVTLKKWNDLPFFLKVQSLWDLNRRCVKQGKCSRDQVKDSTGDRGGRSALGQESGQKSIPFDFFHPLKRVYSNKRTSRILLKGYGFELIKCENQIIYRPKLVLNRKKGYFIKVYPGFQEKIGEYTFQLSTNNKPITTTISVCKLDFMGYKHVILRNRKSGDKIILKNVSKSLKKLYNEWKIPEEFRWIIPVVEDASGVLAVLGKSFGFKDVFSNNYKMQFAGDSKYILKIIKDGENSN